MAADQTMHRLWQWLYRGLPGSIRPFKGEILSVKVANSVAVAEVQVKAYDMIYYDFLSLHKIDGKWVIVSKIMSGINQ